MGHDHHHHLPVDHLNRAFVLGIVLNLVFVCVEFGAGLWFDSVALISDAGHNLSDVVSLVLSLIAFRLARVKPTQAIPTVIGRVPCSSRCSTPAFCSWPSA